MDDRSEVPREDSGRVTPLLRGSVVSDCVRIVDSRFSSRLLVEPGGLEPPTSALQRRRSTS